MAAKEIRPIRFDPNDLDECDKLNIDINDLCRLALKEKIKSTREATDKMEHEKFEYDGDLYFVSVELRRDDTSFTHEFGTKKQHTYEVTEFKAWLCLGNKEYADKEVSKKLLGEIFNEYNKRQYYKDCEELDSE